MKKIFPLSKKSKRILAFFLLWEVLHFILLCCGHIDEFGGMLWPFNGDEIYVYSFAYHYGDGYNWFEFLVYSFTAIVTCIAIKIFKKSKYLAIYLLWFVFNFLHLCCGNLDEFDVYFWPFNGEYIDENHGGYDWFEFFVYMVGPVVIGFIIKLLKDSIEED